MSITNHGYGAGAVGGGRASGFNQEQRAIGTLAGGANGNSALDVQIGGQHYKSVRIQPVEYISANNLNFLEGCIVKRITRWRDKGGVQDLLKIKHEVDLLIEMEGRFANKAEGTATPVAERGTPTTINSVLSRRE